MAWRGAGHLGTPDFMIAFTSAAVMALLCIPFVWYLPPDAAAEVSGHRPKTVG
jgi:hypothetical protein